MRNSRRGVSVLVKYSNRDFLEEEKLVLVATDLLPLRVAAATTIETGWNTGRPPASKRVHSIGALAVNPTFGKRPLRDPPRPNRDR